MRWPEPQPGLVIRYSYLWAAEAREGREEGVKDRPCAIVMAAVDEEGVRRVIVLPITHRPSTDETVSIEIPAATKLRLGLDEQRSWVIVSEFNSFTWPGPDLRPLPGKGPESVVIGFLPRGLFRIVRDRFVETVRQRRSAGVTRTE